MKNILIPILASSLLLFSCNQEKIGDIQGKIKKETISFAPKVTGRVYKILVEEGSQVKPGDTLAILDVPEINAKLSQAEGVFEAASAQQQMALNGATANQLIQLNAKQKGIQEQFIFATKSYERAKSMYNDSMMTPQAFDEATAKYLGAKAQLDAVNAELNEAHKGVRYEQINAASGQKRQAGGVLQEVKTAQKEQYIIATNYMDIQTIALKEGELATAGYPLFNGYLSNNAYCRFTINENRMAQFPIGKEVDVWIPYLDKTVKGTIKSINQLAKYANITTAYPDYKIEEAVYEVKVTTIEPFSSDVLANATVILK